MNSPTFSLRFSNGSVFKSPHIAVSVSKKVSQSAVVRNRVRRRIYSLLFYLIPTLSSGAYLFVVKPGTDKLKIDELESEIKKILREAKMFV